MPNLDKTGPNSEGKLTGKMRGTCIDENTCANGMRKRCCRNVNKDFYQNRRGRMGRNNQE